MLLFLVFELVSCNSTSAETALDQRYQKPLALKACNERAIQPQSQSNLNQGKDHYTAVGTEGPALIDLQEIKSPPLPALA